MTAGLQSKYLSTIGLAARAGRLACGTQNVCDALKDGRAKLVIEADDNSANTKKRIHDRCDYYGVRLIPAYADGDGLAAATGRTGACAAVAVCDESLARAVLASFERAASENNK